ncbi:MAG: DUF5006 domain-containing protein [Parabacteroides sp.]|nr:DUF5006 domain-containing protein [Parabacteroides sp.]
MKNILYKIVPLCLGVLCLAGCKDEVKYLPMAEPVPLTMNVNGKTFVMGERLQAEIKVTPDAEGNAVPANEDFDIYFTAKSGSEDVSGVFESFSKVVVFPKGEKQILVEFPVKESGLENSVDMEFVAFARGYKIANANQAIKVSDFYRITMSVEGSTDNIFTEGDEFTLVATMDKVRSVPVVVNVAAEAGQEGYYVNLPSSLTIPAGELTAKATVTLNTDGEMTGNVELKLNFTSNSKLNPMTAPDMKLTMLDLESLADPDLYDPTKVYAVPELMFMSNKNKTAFESWWPGDKYVIPVTAANQTATTAYPHTNPALAAAGWNFWNAVEFHYITPSFGWNMNPNAGGHRKPWAFSDTYVASMEKYQALDNLKCVNVTDQGILRMWTQYAPGSTTQVSGETRDYVSAGLQTFVKNPIYAPGFARFRKGMRIELRVRVTGVRTGFVPTISLKDISGGEYLTNQNRIDILKNTEGNVVAQRVCSTVEEAAKNTSMPQLGKWNIYWVEWVDDHTINVGINGVTTLTAVKADGWNIAPTTGTKDFGLILYFAPSADREQNALPDGWDSVLKSISDPENDSKTPMMEIDWIRLYVNGEFVPDADVDNKWTNSVFY